MGGRWHIILSADVARWYGALSIRELAQADQALERLATEGIELAMPHNRYLSDNLWEVRFRCGQVNQRITYTADPNRKIVTLTTFRKQRDNERAEIRRARNALRKHRKRKGPIIMTKYSTASADTDYDTVRTQRQAAMTDAERRIYDTAYAEAGWAMELAELVYTTRTQVGLTQAELATAMGTSQSAIAAWESGSRTPGIESLERLARACGRKLHISIGAA